MLVRRLVEAVKQNRLRRTGAGECYVLAVVLLYVMF